MLPLGDFAWVLTIVAKPSKSESVNLPENFAAFTIVIVQIIWSVWVHVGSNNMYDMGHPFPTKQGRSWRESTSTALPGYRDWACSLQLVATSKAGPPALKIAAMTPLGLRAPAPEYLFVFNLLYM
ncbi:hypothetical protein PS2_009942 [Malus domestica]